MSRFKKITASVCSVVMLGAFSVNAGVYESQENPGTWQNINQTLDVRYFFTFPRDRFSNDFPSRVDNELIFNYSHDSNRDKNLSNDTLGLRLAIFSEKENRQRWIKRMYDKGLLKVGDVIIAYRADQSGLGAYPNIMLGGSHAGMIYLDKSGQPRNIDMPLNEEFMQDFARSNLPSSMSAKHFKHSMFNHVIRPYKLSDSQRDNLNQWSQAFAKGSRAQWANSERRQLGGNQIYGSQLTFNSSYNDPLINHYNGTDHVQKFANIALGGRGSLKMFCSEFIWSLLALRNCDMNSYSPSCIQEIFKPMSLLGSYATGYNGESSTGSADGPLLIAKHLNFSSQEEIKSYVTEVFKAAPKDGVSMSSGHRKLAESIPQELFDGLAQYYTAVLSAQLAKRGGDIQMAQAILAKASEARKGIVQAAEAQDLGKTYSPTTFLINAMLPKGHHQKELEYVMTIAFVKDWQNELMKTTLKDQLNDAQKDCFDRANQSGRMLSQSRAQNCLALSEGSSFSRVEEVADRNSQPAADEVSETGGFKVPESVKAQYNLSSSLISRCESRSMAGDDRYNNFHPRLGSDECQKIRKGLVDMGYSNDVIVKYQ